MGFKEEILKTAKSIGLASKEFDSVGIYEWPEVMKKIETNFIIKKNSNTKFNWWWESFKGEQSSRTFPKDDGWTYLNELIDSSEKLWFVGCDNTHDPSKFWLFQGYIEPIQKILSEMYSFDYYIVSKKFEWMLCENHHGVIIGLGSIRNRVENLKIRSSQV